MFKKLLSNLPFNPSLINQVSFYTQRMRSESAIRRTGLVFLLMAMGVQLFATISPAKASLSGSSNDIVWGGFTSQSDAVSKCRNNTQNFGTILSYYLVDCNRLANTTITSKTTVRSTDYGGALDSLGRNPQPVKNPKNGKLSQQYDVKIPGLTTLYMKNLWYWDTYSYSTYSVLKTTNSRGDTIMILLDCGNIITTIPFVPTPPPPPPPPPPPVVLPKSISCSNLVMNIGSGTNLKLGQKVTVRGQAAGQNIPSGQKVDMYYDFVNANTNKVVASFKSIGVPFSGSTANDSNTYDFSSNTADKYLIRLTVKYDSGKTASGSATGNCIKQIIVDRPCEDATTSEDLELCLVLHKSAKNTTQNITNANGTTVKADDIVQYSLSVTNSGKVTVPKFVIKENMNDILEYAGITDFHGGQLDKDNYLFWPALDIKPGQTVQKLITVRIKNPVPQTPASSSDPDSFDLVMTNVYGDSVSINLPPSIVKRVEVTTTLPNTGPGESLAVGFVLTVAVGYFFARSRLFATELDIVRQEFVSSGGI